MNTPLTLAELDKLSETMSTEEFMTDDRVQDYISKVDDASEVILENMSNDMLSGAMSFLLGHALTECLVSGDMRSVALILGNQDAFRVIAGIIFVKSVGIASVEELR